MALKNTLPYFLLLGILFCMLLAQACDNRVTQPEQELQTGAEFIPFAQNSSGKTPSQSEAPSQFGCTLSTLNPESADKNYRYQSFYIKFPANIIEEANGKTINRGFVLNSDLVKRKIPIFLNKKGTVRYVTCKIPDSRQAIKILEQEIQKWGKKSWYNDIVLSNSSTINNPKGNTDTISDWVETCRLEPTGGSITLLDGNGNPYRTIVFYNLICEYEFVNTGGTDGGFGGEGGDTGGGIGANPCNPNVVTPPAGCEEGPGGGGLGGNGGIAETLENDFVVNIDTTNIDCSSSFSGDPHQKTKKAWCASSVPDGENLVNINTALDNIAQRGADCAEIAQKGGLLLNQSGIRVYPSGTIADGGRGGPTFGVLISDTWLSDFYVNNAAGVPDTDGTIIKVNLEFMLVHEIEHTLNREHINLSGLASDWQTPNAVKCSGL